MKLGHSSKTDVQHPCSFRPARRRTCPALSASGPARRCRQPCSGCTCSPTLSPSHQCQGPQLAGGETYLHGERGEHDGRDAILVAVLLERPDEVLASLEGRVGLLDGFVEVDGDDVVDRDEGRVPATVVQTTVEPFDAAVRAGGGSDISCETSVDGSRKEGQTYE